MVPLTSICFCVVDVDDVSIDTVDVDATMFADSKAFNYKKSIITINGVVDFD